LNNFHGSTASFDGSSFARSDALPIQPIIFIEHLNLIFVLARQLLLSWANIGHLKEKAGRNDPYMEVQFV
jgi:hypothetical protein